MQTGIIGLPQVGKTTLFRILTKAHVEAKGAQTTHVGVAKVPEPRLLELAKLYNPKKITYASVQYVDLPGVQKERMRESLATLRDVDAIAHVIRVFEDASVPHSEGTIDPLRDATNLDLELILSDHEQITKRLERLEKDLKKKKIRNSSWKKRFWRNARPISNRKSLCVNSHSLRKSASQLAVFSSYPSGQCSTC